MTIINLLLFGIGDCLNSNKIKCHLIFNLIKKIILIMVFIINILALYLKIFHFLLNRYRFNIHIYSLFNKQINYTFFHRKYKYIYMISLILLS